jgi:ribonuclease HI
MVQDATVSINHSLLFTDGACSGNPGPGGWAGILVNPSGHVVEIGGADPATTNNRMELSAVCEGLSRASTTDPIHIFTDSTYVLRGANEWVRGWKYRGWLTAEGKPVSNRDLWEWLIELSKDRKIRWGYVRGHTGNPGNERCDQIAVQFSQGYRPYLYSGPLSEYSVDLGDPALEPWPKQSKSGPKASPHSYLSLLDGKLMRHPTWAECQARVSGRSGARFKKAMSPEDEIAICREWGVSESGLKSN